MISGSRWCATAILLLSMQTLVAAQMWGESLNESPLTPIPSQMTLEEYRDMNRRLSVALALRVIPVPGIMHYYAEEPETGRKLVRRSLLGVAAIIGGAILTDADDGDFPKSDFDVMILNAGDKKRERRYAQIPVEIEDGTTQYKLRELHRKGEFMPGGPLILLGVATIGYSFVYDFYKGIRRIEEKRDRVRHKYGRELGVQMSLHSSPGDRRLTPGVALIRTF